MISYAKHEEEFYGVFKLVSGEEVLGKAVLTEDSGETLCFIQNPACTVVINNKDDEGRNVRGVGFAKWMQFSDEDFYIGFVTFLYKFIFFRISFWTQIILN